MPSLVGVLMGEWRYCPDCDDKGVVFDPAVAARTVAMGAAMVPCPACEGVITVPVAALRILVGSTSSPARWGHACKVVETLLPKRQCPAYIFGQERHPNGGTQPPHRQLQCGGVEGHSGPHQAPENAWNESRYV